EVDVGQTLLGRVFRTDERSRAAVSVRKLFREDEVPLTHCALLLRNVVVQDIRYFLEVERSLARFALVVESRMKGKRLLRVFEHFLQLVLDRIGALLLTMIRTRCGSDGHGNLRIDFMQQKWIGQQVPHE